jgi:hypothetical protein
MVGRGMSGEVINEVNTTGIVEHVVVMHSPYGVIGLSEVETVSVELLFVNIDQKDAHTIITSNIHHTTNCYRPPSTIHSSSSLNNVI